MSDIKQKTGATGQNITVTLASLANNAARESTFVANAGLDHRDVEVMLQARNHASSAPTGDKAVYVYVWGTVDTATPLYPDAVTGVDAAITLDNPTHLRPLGTLNFTAAAQTKKGGPWNVAAAFGGRVPDRWGIVVENKTGFSLDVTEANFLKKWQGFLDQVLA